MKAGWRETESSGLAECGRSDNFDNIEAIVTAVPTEDHDTMETRGADLKAPPQELKKEPQKTLQPDMSDGPKS